MNDESKKQGKPVAYRQRFICPEEGPSSWVLTESNILTGRPGWEIVPLYTHADPGEVERLRIELQDARDYIEFVDAESEFRRVKLAERDALLIESHDLLNSGHLAAVSTHARQRAYSLIDKIKAVISASA